MRTRHWLPLLVAGMCLAVGTARAEGKWKIPDGFQWGVTFGFYATNGYFSSSVAKDEIEAIARAGATWVTVVPTVWQDEGASAFQYKDFVHTPNDIELMEAIDLIHAKGMKVQLRPMLECKDGYGRLGVWMNKDRERMPGRVSDGRTRWFASMRDRSVYYARIAERTRCELFCLDSELDKMVEENAKWKSVVAAVRGVYSGPVTSCHTLHTGEVDFLAFLAKKDHWFYDLDFLSISYYCPARRKDQMGAALTVDEMVKNLAGAHGRMKAIADAMGRPIVFGECGCSSTQDGARSPSAVFTAVDEDEQAKYMEALFRVFAHEPWCRGFHWWKWDQNSPAKPDSTREGTLARDFTFRGKKAEAVFRRWARNVVPSAADLKKAREKEKHQDLIGYRRCIPMEGFLRTDPGLRQIGLFRTRDSAEIKSSRWSVGCECLDREFADFCSYAKYLGKTGAKRARFFSGWAKTEKEKGKYDFAWLDVPIRHAASVGVKPWICLSYGNPVYNSDLNIGSGVASVVGNPEAFEAWLRYCSEVVRRYGDVVDEWEVWNEPFGKQMDAYFTMLVKTSEAIHRVQPHAKVMVSAVGTVANAKELLARFVAEGRTDAIQTWNIHPYIPNPDDASNAWWGLDSVEEFRRLLAKANPKIRLVQGETGCPGQLEYTHALAMRPWTEYSQAKWELRSMSNYAARSIPYSVFAIVDNQYYDMLQSFGLLRANLKKGVVYARPKYFACRNMFSFFDDGVKPAGMVQADFTVLERRIPQVDPPSYDPPSTNVVPYAVNVARFEKAGTPVLLAWYAHRIPSDALVFDTVRLSVPGVAFRNPVWMDMITGRVFEIDAKDFETKDGMTVFARLPLWDSPVLLAERAQVELGR